MGRKIWAFVAFNAYSLFLLSAFQENTAYLFDASLINFMRLEGIEISLREWGWGGHYLWRLFSGLVVTGLAAILAGAISKSNGKIIAALANVPSVLGWLGQIYFLAFTDVKVDSQTGFIVVSILAVPLTTFVAYVFGEIGESLQKERFPESTVLGIRGYHWVWAIFPIYWYMLSIVFVSTKFLAFQFASWSDMSIFSAIVSLLMLIPVIAWVCPLLAVYHVLSGNILCEKGAVLRGFVDFGILVAGMLLATGIQAGDYWLLSNILK